jgi:hypothetical protein
MPHVEYGKPGNCRVDLRTYEYRLPGGINLRHPCLARGLLALGAVVVEDLVSRINKATNNLRDLSRVATDEDLKEFYSKLPDIDEQYAIICNPSTDLARTKLEEIKKDIRKMLGYKRRAGSVESYFTCLTKGVKYKRDIENNWGGSDNA